MNKWKKIKLGQIVKDGKGILQTGPFGSQLHASDYVDKGVPCIMPANIKGNKIDLSKISFIKDSDANRLSKHLTKTGDIIFSRRGDVTLKALVRNKENGYFCGTGCILVRPGENVDSEFLTYYLSTEASKSWIISKAVGATMPNINTKILAEFPVKLPLKTEQIQISKVLSNLDAKIELNRKINAELEAMAKLIYDYWFVQFDFPISAEQATSMGKLQLEGKPYKSSGGKMVWNEELKREVPEGWEVKELGLEVKIGSGFPFNSNEYLKSGKYKIITIKNVQDLQLDTANVDYVNDLPLKMNSSCSLEISDILMSLTGNVGRICLVHEKNLLLNQRVGKILCDKKLKNLMFAFFQTNNEKARLIKIATGSSQKNLSPVDAVKRPFCFPNEQVLMRYNNLINPIIKKTIYNHVENQKLAELRDWLLPMLMNGQVKVDKLSNQKEPINMAAEEREKYR